MNSLQKLIIHVLEDRRSNEQDELNRYLAIFARYDPADMLAPYGGHGDTPAEILEWKRTYIARIDAAIAWVKSQA